MTASALFVQLLAALLPVLLAPLFSGWVMQCRAWLSNRSAPPLWQPYARIAKLLRKDAVLATDATALFRAVPYILFGSMVAAAAIIPSLSTTCRLPRRPTSSRWSDCSRWRGCSSPWPAWTSARRSARWGRGAKCSWGFSPSRRCSWWCSPRR